METCKEKTEELSELKRQIRLLKNKNSGVPTAEHGAGGGGWNLFLKSNM